MKAEGDFHGMMTDAEMLYLSSMEEVKNISKKLVVAEKAFALVRDRIRNLVSKYEALLAKIGPQGLTTSSIVTDRSSSTSYSYDSTTSSEMNDIEERVWARRAKRAEVEAELVAREALLAKEEAEVSQEEKKQELETLHQRLRELQSEASTATSDRQRSIILAKAIRNRSVVGGRESPQNDQRGSQARIEDVKQRFRDRMAAKMRPGRQQQHNLTKAHGQNTNLREMTKSRLDAENQKVARLVGEEMYQHLDFYERSLKAVENVRGGR